MRAELQNIKTFARILLIFRVALFIRHSRACPGYPEPRALDLVTLDYRVKPEHDEKNEFMEVPFRACRSKVGTGFELLGHAKSRS